ncbi:uncharacterized protein F4807DRAFT_446104 [Annulohypoxylon truncatum]|uniref:uncharacterized protein n=1 Tax=Annulohypoxylon truncatum TaxID=327061 RepID=UPI0020076A6F|nr:uncharacterized protein F4807DRAFT_446104 [Annulohypoxylon truncatum]KAI1204757.1 hypothetical protein F4807DRAFT_446104 [Annulohypoxylon truncatum]
MSSSDTSISSQGSPENYGTVVNVVSWFLLITSSLTILVRLAMKWVLLKRFHTDDGLILVSQVLSISQTIATSIEVANGLGSRFDTLSSDNVTAFQKSFYAANVLSVASQAMSKLSLVFYIRVLSPINLHRASCWVLMGATLLWMLTSVILLLFQCSSPTFWDFITNWCINRLAIWYYINVVNILIDICLIVLPVTVVWKLQTQFKRKLVVISCFTTRILTIAATSWQIHGSQKLNDYEDATYSYWSFVLAMTLAQNLGVMTASVPYLKPFLDSLESGLIRSDDMRRRANIPKSTAGSGQKQTDSSFSSNPPKSTRGVTSHELQDLRYDNSKATVSITAGRAGSSADWESASHSSEAKLIKQVKTWGITKSVAPGSGV